MLWVSFFLRLLLLLILYKYFIFLFIYAFFYFLTQKLAIKTALKQENLNPEIEEKLLQLQRYQEKQMKQEPPEVPVHSTRVAIQNTFNRNNVPARKRPPSATKNDDEDWVMETPKRSRPNRTLEIKKEDTL